MTALRNSSHWLDAVGIGISSACLVHCLLLPVVIVMLPAWSTWLELPEAMHPVLLATALPFSSAVLWRGAKRSRAAKLSLMLGLTGLVMMLVGIFVEKEMVEVALTTAGAVLVAGAHLRNWRNQEHPHS